MGTFDIYWQDGGWVLIDGLMDWWMDGMCVCAEWSNSQCPLFSYCRRFNALPHPHRLVNYDSVGGDDKGTGNNNSTSTSSRSLDATYNARQHKAWDQNSEQMFEQNVTWEDVGWLKANACPHLPLIVKGIMTGEDADQAMNAGADGVMVSNHGGRQLDGALATIDVLPEVVAAVRQRGPVLLDGGVRRGTDVLKALALGATAVGIGKPIFLPWLSVASRLSGECWACFAPRLKLPWRFVDARR
jgi:hypothetical protein